MAKTKPSKNSKKQKRRKSVLNGTIVPSKKARENPSDLLVQATALLQTSQPDEALPIAQRALDHLRNAPAGSTSSPLPPLELLADIYIELGDIDSAREYFARAVVLDPDGEVSGAEKFLWLAQLSEEGGSDSVKWFEKGITALKKNVSKLEGTGRVEDEALALEGKQKLANALCGVVEIYMTDLSWEEDAESRCEKLITEALLVAPSSPGVLQTLASIRISQLRPEDARAALARSMELWADLPPEDPGIPDFPTKISLCRLLMEASMETEALEVLERLVAEDDSIVEAWYLGGWCLWLIGEKSKEGAEGNEHRKLLAASLEWLQNSLKLYELQEYEDERLRDHAKELVEGLNKGGIGATDVDGGSEDA